MKKLIVSLILLSAVLFAPGASVIDSYRFAAGAPPTDFLLDTFTGTNGVTIQSRTGETGATWTEVAAVRQLQIHNNRIFITSGGGYAVFKPSATPPSANYTYECGFRFITVFPGQVVGFDARHDGTSQNGYRVRITDAAIQLVKVVSNTETQIGTGSVSQSWATGVDYVVKFVLSGTSLTVYLDGVSTLTATDSTYTSAGVLGLVYSEGGGGSGSSSGLHTNYVQAY